MDNSFAVKWLLILGFVFFVLAILPLARWTSTPPGAPPRPTWIATVPWTGLAFVCESLAFILIRGIWHF